MIQTSRSCESKFFSPPFFVFRSFVKRLWNIALIPVWRWLLRWVKITHHHETVQTACKIITSVSTPASFVFVFIFYSPSSPTPLLLSAPTPCSISPRAPTQRARQTLVRNYVIAMSSLASTSACDQEDTVWEEFYLSGARGSTNENQPVRKGPHPWGNWGRGCFLRRGSVRIVTNVSYLAEQVHADERNCILQLRWGVSSSRVFFFVCV